MSPILTTKPARETLSLAVLAVTTFAFCAYLQLRDLNIVEPDSLYHFRHAEIYRLHGIFYSSFPWVTASVISKHPADLWYGFHVLLAPFVTPSPSVIAMKLVGAAVATVAVVLFTTAVLRMKLAVPYVWPLLLVAASGFELTRLLNMRPQAISAALAVVLLVAILRQENRLVLACSFAIAWIHLSLFGLALAVGASAFVSCGICEKRWDWRAPAWIACGLVLGWLARPHPVNVAYLLYVQLVYLAHVKSMGLPLDFGAELRPSAPDLYWRFYGPFIPVWGAAVLGASIVAVKKGEAMRTRLGSFTAACLIVSIVFFLITTFAAPRSVDQWIPFAVLLIAGAWTLVFGPTDQTSETNPSPHPRLRLVCTVLVALTTVAIGFRTTQVNGTEISHGISPWRFKGACDWLRDNSPAGSIVYHARWAYFGELFFWNDRNRYINGMDPIFEYAENPTDYWVTLQTRNGPFDGAVTGAAPGQAGTPRDFHEVLTRDFHATFVFVDDRQQPWLESTLAADKRYTPVYADATDTIFRIN